MNSQAFVKMKLTQSMFSDSNAADMEKPVCPGSARFMESNPFLWLLEAPPDFGTDMEKPEYCGNPKFMKSDLSPNFGADMEKSECCGNPKFMKSNLSPDLVVFNHDKGRTFSDSEDDDDQAFVTGEEFYFLNAVTKVELRCDNVAPSKTSPDLSSQHVAKMLMQ